MVIWWFVFGLVFLFVDDCEGEGIFLFFFIFRGFNFRLDVFVVMVVFSFFRVVRVLVLKEFLEFIENSDLVIVVWKLVSLFDLLVKMIFGGSLRSLGRLVEWVCLFNSGFLWWLRLECLNWGMGITVIYLVVEWIFFFDFKW